MGAITKAQVEFCERYVNKNCSFEDFKALQMDVERTVCLLPRLYTPLSFSAAIKSIADANATSIQMLCGTHH